MFNLFQMENEFPLLFFSEYVLLLEEVLVVIKYIKQKEKGNFDLILFVGHLPEGIRKIGLVKIPRKVEPKHFYMMGKIYDNSLSKEVLYDINNWDVNLSDYDLI